MLNEFSKDSPWNECDEKQGSEGSNNMQIKQEVTEKGEGGVETNALFSEHGVPWTNISAIMDHFVLNLSIIYPHSY
jgi:hypothetical protein